MFGSPETTPGGRAALKFYSSCRVDVRRINQLKEGENVIGIRMRVKIVKNKVAPPFRVSEFDMYNTCGISYEADLVDLAVENKIVERSGSWFNYGSTKLGRVAIVFECISKRTHRSPPTSNARFRTLRTSHPLRPHLTPRLQPLPKRNDALSPCSKGSG